MKKITLLSIVVLVFGHIGQAQAAEFSVSTQSLTKYVSNDGFVYHNGAVQQTNVGASFFDGLLQFGYWGSLPWNGHEGFGKENDYTVNSAGEIGKTGINFDVGISYFDMSNLWKTDGDVFNPFLGLSYDFPLTDSQSLTTSTKIELPIVNGDNFADKHGSYLTLNLSHNWQVSEEISVTQGPSFVLDNGPYGEQWGWVGHYNAGINFATSKNTSIDLLVSASTPLSHLSDRETEFVGGVGINYTF